MNKSLEIPSSAGVYLFKNHDGLVIYIGKAKNLKKRVSTYFRAHYTDWKHASLMQEYATLDFIVTKNEDESLLLEADLIQKYQPKYNVLFKDGQPFVYIVFSKDPLPIAAIVRSTAKKGTYFGPFLHKTDARQVLKFLVETFKLSICDKKISGGCLRYHLGICVGSCRGDFNAEDYQFRVQLAMNVLKGDQKAFLQEIKNKISYYNSMHEFERSRRLHNYLENFEQIFSTIKTHYSAEKFVPELAAATTLQEIPGKDESLAHALQQLLKEDKPMHTIDCFDISHFQSRAIVGSCIRFVDGVPVPNKFRRFSIPTFKQQDDYAALALIITRRYREGKDYPDLVFVDGGKGQLSAAKQVLPTISCASIAKREETLYGDHLPGGVRLDLHTAIGRLLIRLRDYTHHFAITYHRLVRSKGMYDRKK